MKSLDSRKNVAGSFYPSSRCMMLLISSLNNSFKNKPMLILFDTQNPEETLRQKMF